MAETPPSSTPAHTQKSHRKAVLQALFVTFLWATSWVLIKIGLREVPALTFAGLRYFLAFLLLLPLALRRRHIRKLQALPATSWIQLVALGLLFYALTQGAQFVGLAFLPAVTVNLLLSFTAVTVALMGVPLLGERPSPRQWGGVGLALVGALVYFLPLRIPTDQMIGYAVVVVGVLANAGSSLIGRGVNRRGDLPPLLVTVVSMGIGATLLLAGGLLVQGLPALSFQGWAIVGWLAAINTAFAFTLWNRTLQTLSAVESSVINGTLLIQIPVLAVIFLGEQVTTQEAIGLVLAAVGAVVVQLGRRPES
ncbi:MAG: DMT family transporter [Anaerolineales bacterium]|nr:DMT family transporter [Anaerolineales bacterium]